MFGAFNEWGKTSSGGPKLKIDGKWVFPKRGCNLDGIEPGMQVEYETSLGGRDGNLVILNRIRPAPQNGAAQPTNGHTPKAAGTACEVSPLDDSGMRFISNLVGSALAAGKVESPQDLTAWTQGAYRALKSIGSGEPGLNDRVPGEDDGRFESDDKMRF